MVSLDGHCKCSKSVMWEFRKQDADRDGYLSHEELGTLEGNMREPCMKPLFKSCDKNNDKKLAHVEWCCCLADTGKQTWPYCLSNQD